MKYFIPTTWNRISPPWRIFVGALLLFALHLSPTTAYPAEVLIVGDIQYKPVADVVAEIRSSLKSQAAEYPISEIRGKLGTVVDRENARIIVALGMDALGEALRLPTSVTVVYGLVISPPSSDRSNITGVYMSTPVADYVSTVKKYLPSISRISVVGSQHLINVLLGNSSGQVTVHRVGSSYDLVNTVSRLSGSEAVLLLPDVNLITSSVTENVFLFSFRNNVPLLGISEGNVKQGSLFALVFDPRGIGRQIGEKVHSVQNGVDAEDMPPSPPKKFNLFVNTNTARKMGIAIPDEMLKKSKRVYQ